MARVMKHSKQVKSAKHLLMTIAWHAHDDGTGAWAGQETLARETGYKPRQIRNLLRLLERSGELRVKPRPGTTALMTVLVRAPMVESGAPPANFAAPTDDATEMSTETAAHPGNVRAYSTETAAHPGNPLPTNPYLTVPSNLQERSVAARKSDEDEDDHRRDMRVADELARDASPRAARGGALRTFAEIAEARIAHDRAAS